MAAHLSLNTASTVHVDDSRVLTAIVGAAGAVGASSKNGTCIFRGVAPQ